MEILHYDSRPWCVAFSPSIKKKQNKTKTEGIGYSKTAKLMIDRKILKYILHKEKKKKAEHELKQGRTKVIVVY